MVLASGHWLSNQSKLKRVVELINTPPYTKTLGQLALENGFNEDGEQMCRLLVTNSYMTEQQLQAYRKQVRSNQS